ncbi:MAG TPA: ABC transporter substrate-binding protein [Microbacterium sp.]|uniref:ABC transporter substrate-binding protein n=1 Tax=Microbacterium sp. TaxID=51671 RepID=UPI002BBB2F6D|nr:ABC transporter substrate-binding protein [Microbacterium sp.]HWI32176.1 ABC transporter substrate-binding protein [Microbacterium sp.]
MMLHKKKAMLPALAAGAGLVLVIAGCSATGGGSGGGSGSGGDETIKIGVLSTDTGNLAFGMGETKAAIGVAMDAIGGTVEGGEIDGHKIEFVYAGTDGTPGTAQDQVRKLVENEGVDIVFGPLSGDEGEAVADYALTQPDVTFVNGSAAPVDLTLKGAENFYRFAGDGAQWTGGLGDYAFNDRGYKNTYLVAEDYSFPYDNAGGFFSEFCAAGGTIAGASWVPVGTTDYATIISQIPADADSVFVGLGGSDAASFLSQAVSNGVNLPLIGGSIAVDTTALAGDANLAQAAVGTITAGPVPGAGYENPAFQPFVDAYKKQPDAFPSPSLFALVYYSGIQSIILALQDTGGELGEGQATLREALDATSWDTPTGPLTIDENRNAIVDNFLIEVKDAGDGTLTGETIKEAHEVHQGTHGFTRFESCDELG